MKRSMWWTESVNHNSGMFIWGNDWKEWEERNAGAGITLGEQNNEF